MPPPYRSYTSVLESVSAATSASAVWMKTWVPSSEAPAKWASTGALPPAGPVDSRVTTPASLMYMS